MASLVLVINPSPRAMPTEVRHAQQIFNEVSARGPLWMLGIYEQRGSNDGLPFNVPFMQTQTPSGRQLQPYDSCREDKGTAYQRAKCKESHDKTREANVKILGAWRTAQITKIVSAGSHTEEALVAGGWDLAGTLRRAGDDLEYAPGKTRCVVLLGGLFVKQPPSAPDLSKLKGVTIVAAGWRSSSNVRDGWTTVMRDAGADLKLLPVDVTDIVLTDVVAECATPRER